MRRASWFVLLSAACLAWGAAVSGSQARDGSARRASFGGLPVVKIGSGRFTPLYRPAPDVTDVAVPAFWLMTRPVTNADFLAFVAEHPEYRRSAIARVFADQRYLTHWSQDTQLGMSARAAQPVTNVSWFAASAFCEARGMRLPREAEWELAALASPRTQDASRDPAFRKALLDWYSTPRAELADVQRAGANVYGVFDLHGLIWEWVEDFNNAVVVADSRGDGDSTRDKFCGAGAVLAQDTLDYAAFMRVAMRSALEGAYTGALLGFRCAADGTRKPGSGP
jgi:formylglycine-generating enzyme